MVLVRWSPDRTVTEQDIRSVLLAYGDVDMVAVNQKKGQALVEFTTEDGAVSLGVRVLVSVVVLRDAEWLCILSSLWCILL